MLAVALLVIIVTTVLVIVALQSFIRRNGKFRGGSEKIPPGNMGWPLIGETPSFLKPHLPTTVGEFMEHRMSRFGKIFSSNLMGMPTIITADPKLNRFVLKNDLRLFGPGWASSFKNVVGPESLGLAVGDAHKNMRSTVLEFLSGQRLRTIFLRDADQLASILIDSWKEGSTISAKTEATKFSLSIMMKKLISITLSDSEIAKLSVEYDSFFKGFRSIPLYIPGTTYWKALQSREKISQMFKREMKKRTEADHEDDFVGWLMNNTNYSHEKMSTLLVGLLFAGHHTTARSISLMIYFLQDCPKAIKQLRDEHLQVVQSKKQRGDNKLAWEDYKSMEFTKCVINETLRLGNIASFLPKKATQDVEFEGIVIPKGWNVLVNFSAVHLDPSLYEDPEHFNPWRWLNSSGLNTANNFTPFGGGARLCPGSELARLEMAVFLHHLILKYDWESAEPDNSLTLHLAKILEEVPIKVYPCSAY